LNPPEEFAAMKIAWGPQAQSNLKAIFDYIAKERPSGVARVHDRILRTIRFLAERSDMDPQGSGRNLR